MKNSKLLHVEAANLRPDFPKFDIGDTVDVHTKILEGNKERIQIFSGVVIARAGSGTRENFTVRRLVQGEGVERKFPVCSPKIATIEVTRSSVVRRAKLYYLRDRIGKSVRLAERQRDVVPGKSAKAAKTVKAAKKKPASSGASK